MAITYDSSATATASFATNASGTIVIADQTNRLCWIGMRTNDTSPPGTTTSVTVGSVSGTKWGELQYTGGADIYELWYVKNPTVGSQPFVVNFGTSTVAAVTATNYYGVNQTTSFGANASGTVTDETSLSVTLNPTSYANSMIYVQGGRDGGTEIGVSGCTQRASATNVADVVVSADQTTTSTGSYTVAVSGESSNYLLWAVEMNPAGATITSKNTQAVCFW